MTQTPYLIRPTRPEDAADIAAYMADPAVFGDLLQLPHPTEAQWRERLSGLRAGNDLSLVAEQGGHVVASAGLFNQRAQVRRQHASALGISVATPAQGQGIGRALMAALTDYADRWGHILRIELSVFADNTRAIALYERFGFVREGLHRCHALRDGVYVDTLSMARLHPNPPHWPAG